jgi:glycosyltransferase involved in cell wall biosynthesis
MTDPTVSAIVPVFNCERYLPEALESILDQGYGALDVVVVDDGSSDRSAELASSYPVRILRIAHGGIARARNAGVDAARGELITFLDADDTWTPGNLRLRVDRLLERPELDAVLGRMDLFIQPGTERPEWYRSAWDLESQNALLGGLLAWRRVFDRVGRFDPTYEIGEDTDWLARFKDAKLSYEHLPDVIMRYRRHDTNTTYRRELVAPNLVRILKASIDRQRQDDEAASGA